MVESITGEFSKSGDFTISSSRDLLVNGKRSGTVQEQEVRGYCTLKLCDTWYGSILRCERRGSGLVQQLK